MRKFFHLSLSGFLLGLAANASVSFASSGAGEKPAVGTPQQLEDCLVERARPLIKGGELEDIRNALGAVIGDCPQPAEQSLEGAQAVQNAIKRLSAITPPDTGDASATILADSAGKTAKRFHCAIGQDRYQLTIGPGRRLELTRNDLGISVDKADYTQDGPASPMFLEINAGDELYELRTPDSEGDGRYSLAHVLPGYTRDGSLDPSKRRAGLCTGP